MAEFDINDTKHLYSIAWRILRGEEAKDRKEYQKKIRERIAGAIGEWHKARLLEKNGILQQSLLIDYWKREANSHLQQLIDKDIWTNAKGINNRRKAVDDVIAEFKNDGSGERVRRWAYNEMTLNRQYKKLGLTKNDLKVPLDDSDTEDFWELVASYVAKAFKIE